MFIVKWEDCYLAPFDCSDSADSRTFNRKFAMEFKYKKDAQKRIDKIREFRRCKSFVILPAD